MASLDETLATINKQYWDDYLKNTTVVEQELIDQYNNVDTREQATKDAITARRVLGGMDERSKARYGVVGSAGQQAYEAKQRRLGDRATIASARNNALLEDDAYKGDLLTGLLKHGTQLRNASQAGLGAAANMEADRDAANEAAKNARRQATAGMVSTGIGLAAAALI